MCVASFAEYLYSNKEGILLIKIVFMKGFEIH